MKFTHYIGLPGTGKTTLMREKLAKLRKKEQDEMVADGPVKYHLFSKQKTIVFGIYDESTFAGTDRLAKSVGPKFREWVVQNKELLRDWELFSEGERFSNNPTLDHLFEHCDMELVCLVVSEGELARRRAARNNTQNESWMKGMVTRVSNLCAKYPHTVEVLG